jgi:hypothetical protein
MTPDEQINQFQNQVQRAIEKYNAIQSAEVDLLTERTMKVVDHKVAAVGEMIQAKNSRAAERSLDSALKAIERLNAEFDALIAQKK